MGGGVKVVENEGASGDVDENKGERKKDCGMSRRLCGQNNPPDSGRYVSRPPQVGWRDGRKKKNFCNRTQNVYENKGNVDITPEKIRTFLSKIRAFLHKSRTFLFNRDVFCKQKPDFDETLPGVSRSDKLVTP